MLSSGVVNRPAPPPLGARGLTSLAAVVASLLVLGCQSAGPLLESPIQTVERARLLLEQGKGQKAARLIRHARGLEPGDPAVAQALLSLIDEAWAAIDAAETLEHSDGARLLLCAAVDRMKPVEAETTAEPLDARKEEGPGDGERPPITPPEALYTPTPQYTDAARAERYQSTVITRLVISKAGCVIHVDVLADDDHELAKTYGLVDRTVETLSTWVYRPALLDGEPVAVYWNTFTNFRLK